MARLAIAQKSINTERFKVGAGEPLPPKYQVGWVVEWIKKKFGKDSVDYIHFNTQNQLFSIALEKQKKALQAELSARDERISQLEKEITALKTNRGRTDK